MEKLIRRTFALTKRQMDALKLKAEELGISIADLARRIFDEWLEK